MIFGTIYIIGCIIALIIGIVEMIKDHSENAQYGLIWAMVILSWITVILYIYNYFKSRNELI